MRSCHSAIQETPCFYGTQRFIIMFTKGHITRQMHSVHTFTPYFTKIHANTTFPSTLRTSKWSLPFRFPDQNLVCISHLSHCVPHALPLPSSLICTCYEAVHSAVFSSLLSYPSFLLGPNILLSTLFLKHPQSVFFP